MSAFEPVRYAALTDVGVKRSHNQDACSARPAVDAPGFATSGHIFVVADGMGGHAVGEKASAKAVQDIPHLYQKHVHEGVIPALHRAFNETNSGIHAIGQENPEFRGHGDDVDRPHPSPRRRVGRPRGRQPGVPNQKRSRGTAHLRSLVGLGDRQAPGRGPRRARRLQEERHHPFAGARPRGRGRYRRPAPGAAGRRLPSLQRRSDGARQPDRDRRGGHGACRRTRPRGSWSISRTCGAGPTTSP